MQLSVCVLWKSTKCYLEFVLSCLRSFEGAYISLSVYTVGKNAQKHWMGQWERNPSNKANLSAVFELQIPGSSGLPHLNKILKWNSLKMIRCLNDLLSFHEYMSRCQRSLWKANQQWADLTNQYCLCFQELISMPQSPIVVQAFWKHISDMRNSPWLP